MPLIFDESSVLVSQPLLLDIRQRRFLVGIRFAVESLELSRARLWEALGRWHEEGRLTGGAMSVAGLFTDAWSIVDNARRLQRLMWKMPFSGEVKFAEAFVNRWLTLKTVRDAVQHIDGDLLKPETADDHVYGQLFWIDARFRETEGNIYAYSVPAGPQANPQLTSSQFPVEIPIDAGETIDQVVLRAGGVDLNITALLNDVEETVGYFAARVEEAVMSTIANELAAHPEKADRLKLMTRINTGFRLELSPMFD